MAFASDPDLLVLHGLRLKGFAEIDAVAELVGLDTDDVSKRVDVAEVQGWVKHREGRVSGWTLTAAGRAEGERRLAEELDMAGALEVVHDAYHRFLAQNAAVLRICTEWQMKEVDGRQVINDHDDIVYDTAIVEELAGVDAAAQPICSDLSEVLDRFASYGPRLENALARIRAGELDWFTGPTIDSYHTVWFELHENLLATLGIERGAE